jgi:hypothetical protein
MVFLIVVIDYDASHKYADKILCCFGCGLEKRSVGKLMSFFKEIQLQELYLENSPPPPSNLL